MASELRMVFACMFLVGLGGHAIADARKAWQRAQERPYQEVLYEACVVTCAKTCWEAPK